MLVARRGLDAVVTCLARLMVRVFFREIELAGIERLPHGVPLVIASNHTNSVVDGILLLALPGVRPRLLAKSTLWSHPFMRPLLVLAGALPVYRRQDPGVDMTGNFATFARCHEALAGGVNIALFPEGTSHNEPHALPLKTGAARIVLEAEAERGPLGVRIVPVGLSYEAKGRFRSKVRVSVGHPIDPAAEVARYGTQPGVAVRALTARIAEGLGEVTRAEGWPEERRAAVPSSVWGVVRLLLRIPVFLAALVFNWIPYRVPGWVSDRLSTTPDEPATYKLLAGLLTFPLVWSAEVALAAHAAGAVWGLAVAVAAPTCGYYAALRLPSRSCR